MIFAQLVEAALVELSAPVASAQERPAAMTPADMTVTGDEAQIRALGFVGVMTVGLHQQAHHLAIATGTNVHD